MTMTLFHSNVSPNSRRVRIFIAEKGLHRLDHVVTHTAPCLSTSD